MAQEKDFLKEIINDQIKLDLILMEQEEYPRKSNNDFLKNIVNDQIKLKHSPELFPQKSAGDSLRVVILNVNKSPLVFATFNYGINPTTLDDLEELPSDKKDTVLKISPAFLAPFTNPKAQPAVEINRQLEFMHGGLYWAPRPAGVSLPGNRKSHKEKRKEEKLRYIMEEVYQVGDSIWKPSK